jgi:hypothetical protein
MFCITDNNAPKNISNHRIFYKKGLYIIHMNEFVHFYNILRMDTLTRMIFFQQYSKKIEYRMINIHFN